MKKLRFLFLVSVCLVSFTSQASIKDNEPEFVKVLSEEEVEVFTENNALNITVESMKLFKTENTILIEVKGFDAQGNAVTQYIKDDIEILPCGTCRHGAGPPWGGYDGQLVVSESMGTFCQPCTLDEIYGPVPSGPQP